MPQPLSSHFHATSMRGQQRNLGRSKIQGLDDVRELANEDEQGKNG
jgi:hypothetical protein